MNSCSPTLGVPNNYRGFQNARTGNAYIGMYYKNASNQRNYFQVKLLDSLKKGKYYYAECYVNLANNIRMACNNQSILFTNNITYADTVNKEILIGNPQITSYSNPIITDTLNWVKVSGIFSAQGGEQYLTLGNFRDDANTLFVITQPTADNGAVYFADDVAVYNLDSFCLKADAGRDTTIKLGDSVFIGSYTNGIDTIKWYNSSGQVIDSTRPGFWVKPTAVGTYMYVLLQTVNGCFSKDTVYVNVTTLPLKIMSYELLIINGHTPNPSQEGNVENIWQTANEVNVSHYNIERSVNGKDFIVVGKVKAKNGVANEYRFEDGVGNWELGIRNLYYRVVGVDNDGRKAYSEVRKVELGIGNLVSVFPNPARNVVNVVGSNIKEVKLFDMFGGEIATGTNLCNDGINTNHLSLNINHYPKGLYILQVRLVNDVIVNSKILIE